MFKTEEIRNEFHQTTERRLHDGRLLEVRNSQRKDSGFREYYERRFGQIDRLIMEDANVLPRL